MTSTSEIEKIKDQDLRNKLTGFIENIQTICGQNLKSIILYGGVAKDDYKSGKSNTNVLMVFEKIDIRILHELAVPLQMGISTFRLSPFMLTTSEIAPAKNVFAVKLFDIQQHHLLLFGENVVDGLSFNREHLRFIAEQELRNQLSRMKYFYIQLFNLAEKLLDKIQKSFTTLLINSNTYLYLKNGLYLTSRTEIINSLDKEPAIDKTILNELNKLRKAETIPDHAQAMALYGSLMLQYKHVIKELEKLPV